MDINKKIVRFHRGYDIDPITECWNWRGWKSKSGYGMIRYKHKGMRAHRFSYMIHRGNIPEGKLVCHHCDNPKCVNPDHLFVGTALDNIQDMIAKGRAILDRGGGLKHERNGRAVMNFGQVTRMRRMFETGKYSKLKLSKIFGISWTQTARILNGEQWV